MRFETGNIQELLANKSARPALIGIAAFLVIVTVLLLSGGEDRYYGEIHTVARSDMEVISYESSEIVAVNSTEIRAPGGRGRRWDVQLPQIVFMIDEGENVAKGDTLIKFDTTDLMTQLETLEDQLVDARQAYEELIETHKSQDVTDERQIQNSLFSLENARLNLELAKFEAATVIRERELELQIQVIDSMKVITNIEAQRAIREFNAEQARDKINEVLNDISEVQTKIDSYTFTAPFPGLVIHAKDGWPVPAVVKEGDSPFPSQKMISLPDLSQLKAVIRLNDIDRDRVKTGMRGRVRPDAFPDEVYEGEIVSMELIPSKAISQAYSNLKIIEAELLIDGTNGSLRPGMSAVVELIIDEKNDVLQVPLSSVFELDDRQYVYMADGDDMREVTTGIRCHSMIEITDGLEAGEEILSQYPIYAGFPLGQYTEWRRRIDETAVLSDHFEEMNDLGIQFNYDEVRGKPVELNRPRGGGPGEIDDERIKRILERMGRDVTPENIQEVKKMIEERRRTGGGRGQGMRGMQGGPGSRMQGMRPGEQRTQPARKDTTGNSK